MSFHPPEQFNIADYFLDARVREGRGERIALITDEGRLSYGQVEVLANRFGHLLRQAGAEPEQRVLIALPDSPAFVGALFGTLKIGAVVVMVNPELKPEAIEYFLNYSRATVAVIHRDVSKAFEAAAGRSIHLKQLLVVEDAGWQERLADAPAALANFPTHRDDAAIWLFSGGTTGHPKAVVQTHTSFANTTECYARQVIGYTETDVTLSVPKLFFGYATGTNLLFPFAVGGATALFSERSEAPTLFDVIERYRPTILTSVPTMIGAMLNAPGAAGRDLSSLRLVLSAGEALPPELYRRWKETFGVEILDGIGSAEMFHIYISNYPGDVVPGSLGRLVPGYDARIVGPDGADVPPGEAGTLWIKGESAAILYWQAHEKSKETLRGDWVVTGDHMRRDEGGYFWYEGRTDDMLKVGGIFVSPCEVENCLLQHPVVAECAVIGYKDRDGLIKPKAYVVPRDRLGDDALARELQDFVKTRLAPFKYPRVVEFALSLPKNDRGKIDRRRLAAS